jgi:8-oxo-dGTP pyrophosphatase MutT (NUDIX family)
MSISLFPMTGQQNAIRNAASVIVLRRDPSAPNNADKIRILMGQRAKAAVFMPHKVVFPGGGVDRADATVVNETALRQSCINRLSFESAVSAGALVQAAARELCEETGLHLKDRFSMHFIFRAITPKGLPRRYDARFFMVDAADCLGDLDDFSKAEDELSDLTWVTIEQANALNIARVTRLVLDHVQMVLNAPDQDMPVPFFDMRNTPGQRRSIV